MSKFEIGDKVQLKSGGPVMTIEKIDNEEKIQCVWFKDVELESANFMQDTLEHFEEINFDALT